MTPEYIYVRAEVIHREEKTRIVRLQDGFGNAETPVHQDYALPESAVTKIPEEDRVSAMRAALIDEHPAYKDRLHKTVAHRCMTCRAINGVV